MKAEKEGVRMSMILPKHAMTEEDIKLQYIDYQETLMRLAEEFTNEEPDFRAVEFELIVADA